MTNIYFSHVLRQAYSTPRKTDHDLPRTRALELGTHVIDRVSEVGFFYWFFNYSLLKTITTMFVLKNRHNRSRMPNVYYSSTAFKSSTPTQNVIRALYILVKRQFWSCIQTPWILPSVRAPSPMMTGRDVLRYRWTQMWLIFTFVPKDYVHFFLLLLTPLSLVCWTFDPPKPYYFFSFSRFHCAIVCNELDRFTVPERFQWILRRQR